MVFVNILLSLTFSDFRWVSHEQNSAFLVEGEKSMNVMSRRDALRGSSLGPADPRARNLPSSSMAFARTVSGQPSNGFYRSNPPLSYDLGAYGIGTMAQVRARTRSRKVAARHLEPAAQLVRVIAGHLACSIHSSRIGELAAARKMTRGSCFRPPLPKAQYYLNHLRGAAL